MKNTDTSSENIIIKFLLKDCDNAALVPDLKPEHFSQPLNALIFSTCQKLYSQNGRYSIPELIPFLFFESTDTKPVNTLERLANSETLIFYDIKELAESVKATYLKRKFDECLTEFTSRALVEPAQDLVLEMHSKTEGLLTDHSSVKTKTSIEVFEDLTKSLDETFEIYPTGLTLFDNAMAGGLVAGKAYGIAARKKSGKTAFMCTVAQNLNKRGISTLYIALEMGSREMMQRIVARELKEFPQAFINERRLNPDFRKRVNDYLSLEAPKNLNFIDRAGISFSELKIAMQIGVMKHKAKVVVLDYWQLVGGKDNKKSTSEHLDEVAQWLAEFAKRHQVAVLTASQVNQDGNTRGGEGLRLAFDQIYQLHRIEGEGEPMLWVEMMDTRYTAWTNMGSEAQPAFRINSRGVYFEQL